MQGRGGIGKEEKEGERGRRRGRRVNGERRG